MATYSKATTTGNYTIYLIVSNVDQDVANNQSKVQYKAYITGASGTSSWGTGNWSLNINGTTSSGSIQYDFASSKTWYCVGSASTYVTSGYIAHNSDGTKSITVAFSFTGASLVGSATISQTFTLDTIPRASDVSVSAYTIANTSGSLSATITSKANFYHKWRWKLASGSWSSWTNKGLISTTSSTVTVANTSLLSNLPSATSGSFTIEVATYSDSGYATHVGTKSATATVSVNTSNIKPSVSLANISMNSTPISGYAVAGYSKAQTTCTTTNSSGASSFTNYFTVSHGSLQTSSSTSASTTVITNTLPSSASNYTLTISAYAKDSRGAVSSTVSKTVTVYGYQPPTATLSAYRVDSSTSTTEDGAGTYVYVTFSGAVKSSVNSQNTVQSTACTYSGSISGTATNGGHYALADNQNVTFTLTVTDKVTSSTATVTVSRAKYPLDLYDNGSGSVGVGFGTVAVANQVKSALPLYVQGTGRFKDGITLDTSVNASLASNNVTSTTYPTTMNILDSANRIIARTEAVVNPNGNIGMYMYVRNYNTSGTQVAQKGLQFHMNKSGALSWSVSDPANFVSSIKSSIVNAIYPVGSIYMSVNSTSPATLFGGTWEQLKDRFLLGAGSTYSNGATGGSATHTLAAANLPAQSGDIEFHGIANGSPVYGASGVFSGSTTVSNKYKNGGTNSTGANSKSIIKYSNGGSSTAVNHMPPYLVVYMWKRTA